MYQFKLHWHATYSEIGAQLTGADDDIVVNLVMNAIFDPDVIAGAKTLDPYALQVEELRLRVAYLNVTSILFPG